MKFLFRTNANNEIGTGHVMRCIAFGQLLKDEGHEVTFLTQTTNEGLLNKLRKEDFGIMQFDEKPDLMKDAEITIEKSKELDIDWIITDNYKFTTEYQKRIKENNYNLLCIDDLAETHFVSDIVLNQNINAVKIFNYSCEPYTKLLLGTKCVLLRREFRREKNWQREFNEDCKNILITMGGSDPENSTSKILNAVEEIDMALNIKVILGSSYNFIDEIEELKNNSKHNIEVLINIENLVPDMKWADLALTAAGTTVWELAYLQTPMIVGVIADNQIHVAVEMEKEGFAMSFGWVREINSDKIISTIKIALTSAIRLRLLNNLKNQFIRPDLKSILKNFVFEKKIYLRPFSKDDIKRIYELSNDPLIRENSISNEKITWEAHVNWYKKKLADDNYIIFLAFDIDDRFIGQVKFEVENDKAIISISITEHFRGEGLAKELLKISVNNFFSKYPSVNLIIAYIKPSNISSIKGFKKAGFKLKENEKLKNRVYKKFIFKKDEL